MAVVATCKSGERSFPGISGMPLLPFTPRPCAFHRAKPATPPHVDGLSHQQGAPHQPSAEVEPVDAAVRQALADPAQRQTGPKSAQILPCIHGANI